MKVIIHNKDNLLDSEITEVVVRVKALIIKGTNILIANASNVLQFPGGHLEDGETLNDCLKREVREETGIVLEDKEINECILKVIWKNKDWPSIGINRKNEIYYYVIKTDKLVDLNNTFLTKQEKAKKFEIESIPIDDSIEYITNNIKNDPMNDGISPDMICAIKEYLRLEGVK